MFLTYAYLSAALSSIPTGLARKLSLYQYFAITGRWGVPDLDLKIFRATWVMQYYGLHHIGFLKVCKYKLALFKKLVHQISTMNPKVDFYFGKAKTWQQESSPEGENICTLL